MNRRKQFQISQAMKSQKEVMKQMTRNAVKNKKKEK